MTLVKALHNGPPPDPRRKCGVGEWVRGLPDDERDAAEQMLADAREWPATTLDVLFRAEGCPVGRSVIDRHRAGGCACVTR